MYNFDPLVISSGCIYISLMTDLRRKMGELFRKRIYSRVGNISAHSRIAKRVDQYTVLQQREFRGLQKRIIFLDLGPLCVRWRATR